MSIRFRAKGVLTAAVVALALAFWGQPALAAALDFSKAVVVTSASEPKNVKAAQFLQLEIARRTGISLQQGTAAPAASVPVIALGKLGSFPGPLLVPAGLAVPAKAEGFAVWVTAKPGVAPTVYVVGRDDKGVLFGAGYLLRKMYLAKDYVCVSDGLRAASAPEFPVRGEQVVPQTQSKDRFLDWKDPAQIQQYVRDLAIFGNNTIEPTTKADELAKLATFCGELGIDLAYTANCADIVALNTRSDDEIRAWLSDAKGIAQFVTYGGDHAGAKPPQETFPAMERVVPLVLQSHPGATWWYSNQCMGEEATSHAVDFDYFTFPYLKSKQPTWLYGLIYGPWTKRGIPDLRGDIPAQYKIRHYPDICHVQWCMYPVPKWDRPWAQVWERGASIYAAPRVMRAIHNACAKDMIGSTPYNHTGTYNDLNKFVFAAMDWNSNGDLKEFMRDYARVFIAYQFVYSAPSPQAIDAAADKVASALFGLEDNWTGPLAKNDSPVKRLKDWKDIVALSGGPEKVRNNWRLDMLLTRAVIDAQVKKKYDAELRYQQQAYDALRQASKVGAPAAIANARVALAKIDTEFQSQADFEKELGTWGVSDRFGDREATLKSLYLPLTDRRWLEAKLDNAKTVADIDKIVNYEDPGLGGFYDDLGNEAKQPHLVKPKTWEQDPGFVYSPFDWNDHDPGSKRRHSQMDHALARYNTPLVMRWEGLDKNAPYHIEVVYLGPFKSTFRCDTDDGLEIHGSRGNSDETPVSYDIPRASTKDGVLQLEWRVTSNTRGVSVSEIWLKKGATAAASR